jgi:hypothetical protein
LLVLNKWNRKWYKVLKKTEKTVTLEREEDKEQFTISLNEFYNSYLNTSEKD